MFELWRRRHIAKPSDYYRLPEGEKVVVRAFLHREIELEPPPGKGG